MFTDIIPPTGRKYVYAIVALAALVFGAWQASDGNWAEAFAALLAALVNGMAHGNTNNPEPGDEQ